MGKGLLTQQHQRRIRFVQAVGNSLRPIARGYVVKAFRITVRRFQDFSQSTGPLTRAAHAAIRCIKVLRVVFGVQEIDPRALFRRHAQTVIQHRRGFTRVGPNH